RDVPGDEREHAEQAELDPKFGVGGLARLDLPPGALRGHAGVADAVSPRMFQDGPDAVAEAVQVAVDRRLARVERAAARRLLLPAGALDRELRRREAGFGRDVGIGADEEE